MPPRQRNIRKRKTEDDVEERETGSSEGVAETEGKAIVPGGVSSLLVVRLDVQLPETYEHSVRNKQQVLDRGEEPPVGGMLGAFSKEQAKDAVELDPNMQAYVEEQMAKRLGVRKAEEGRAMLRDPEAQLYITPDELKIDPIKPQEVPGSWLTGITEVQLPAHYKLKNIEETEAAKKRLLQPGNAAEDEDSDEGRQELQQTGLPRGVYPRGFGRESGKVAEVRKANLVKQTLGPSRKEKRQRGR